MGTPRVSSTPLPGIGVRYDLATRERRRLSVIAHRDGARTPNAYREDDPDACSLSVRLTAGEASALVDAMGPEHHSPNLLSTTEPGPVAERIELSACSHWNGRVLGDTRIRSRTGASVVAALRRAEAIPYPAPDFRLAGGDVLVVIGTREGVQAAAESSFPAPADGPVGRRRERALSGGLDAFAGADHDEDVAAREAEVRGGIGDRLGPAQRGHDGGAGAGTDAGVAQHPAVPVGARRQLDPLRHRTRLGRREQVRAVVLRAHRVDERRRLTGGQPHGQRAGVGIVLAVGVRRPGPVPVRDHREAPALPRRQVVADSDARQGRTAHTGSAHGRPPGRIRAVAG